MAKKKHWGGKRTARAKRAELICDSYQADAGDLKKLRKLAKSIPISKAKIIRYGIKLALEAHENGTTTTFDFEAEEAEA